jgi:uncharacterized membrane protein
MRCDACGVDLIPGAAFCPSCGRPAGSVSIDFLRRTPSCVSPEASLPPNVAGFLCYLAGFVTGIFFLAVGPYKQDHFVRFHAYQAIFLSVGCFAAYFPAGMFFGLLPGMVWRAVLRAAVNLAFLGLWVFLMYKAYHNEEFKVPVIGELAAKQA